VIKKTPKGQPSTAEDVLEELALSHELPRLILEHRSLSKLKSTYTDKLRQVKRFPFKHLQTIRQINALLA
jgi:DNA polymerase-1